MRTKSKVNKKVKNDSVLRNGAEIKSAVFKSQQKSKTDDGSETSCYRKLRLRGHTHRFSTNDRPCNIDLHTDDPDKISTKTEGMEKQMFQCIVCHQKFSKRTILEKHVIQYHPIEKKSKLSKKHTTESISTKIKPFSSKTNCSDSEKFCNVCEKEFSSSNSLSRHIKRFHSACKRANETNHDIRNGADAVKLTTNKVKNNSDLADEIDANIELYTEMETDASDNKQDDFVLINLNIEYRNLDEDRKPFVCDVCFTLFKSVNEITNHKRIVGCCKKTTCCYCRKRFSDVPDLHIHVEQCARESRLQICTVCNNIYQTKSALRKHMLKHAGKTYDCPLCRKTYTDNSSLKTHMLKHEGKKPHVCELCDKPFVQRSHLQRHMKMHTGEKIFICDVCGKSFTDTTGLRCHSLTHEDNRSCIFTCDECGKSYTTRSGLFFHQKGHSGMNRFPCDICKRVFTQKVSLQRHSKKHTSHSNHGYFIEPTIFCHLCRKGFTNQRGLTKHMLKHKNGLLKSFSGNQVNTSRETEDEETEFFEQENMNKNINHLGNTSQEHTYGGARENTTAQRLNNTCTGNTQVVHDPNQNSNVIYSSPTNTVHSSENVDPYAKVPNTATIESMTIVSPTPGVSNCRYHCPSLLQPSHLAHDGVSVSLTGHTIKPRCGDRIKETPTDPHVTTTSEEPITSMLPVSCEFDANSNTSLAAYTAETQTHEQASETHQLSGKYNGTSLTGENVTEAVPMSRQAIPTTLTGEYITKCNTLPVSNEYMTKITTNAQPMPDYIAAGLPISTEHSSMTQTGGSAIETINVPIYKEHIISTSEEYSEMQQISDEHIANRLTEENTKETLTLMTHLHGEQTTTSAPVITCGEYNTPLSVVGDNTNTTLPIPESSMLSNYDETHSSHNANIAHGVDIYRTVTEYPAKTIPVSKDEQITTHPYIMLEEHTIQTHPIENTITSLMGNHVVKSVPVGETIQNQSSSFHLEPDRLDVDAVKFGGHCNARFTAIVDKNSEFTSWEEFGVENEQKISSSPAAGNPNNLVNIYTDMEIDRQLETPKNIDILTNTNELKNNEGVKYETVQEALNDSEPVVKHTLESIKSPLSTVASSSWSNRTAFSMDEHSYNTDIISMECVEVSVTDETPQDAGNDISTEKQQQNRSAVKEESLMEVLSDTNLTFEHDTTCNDVNKLGNSIDTAYAGLYKGEEAVGQNQEESKYKGYPVTVIDGLKLHVNTAKELLLEIRKENLICNICKAKFNCKYSLRRHLLAHKSEQEKIVAERAINAEVNSEDNGKDSENGERIEWRNFDIDEKGLRCKICKDGKYYVSVTNIMEHVKSHREHEKKYMCKKCPEEFYTKWTLNIHKRSAHRIKETKRFICEVCARSFGNSGHLNRHIRMHQKQTSSVCPQCGKFFLDKKMQEIHQRSHLTRVSFPCDLCPKQFSTSSNLSRHKTSHVNASVETSRVAKFVCSICEKTFTAKNSLQAHMLIHSGIRPYVCECGSAFKQRSHLQRHKLLVHGDKCIQCKHCDKYFSEKVSLTVHMRVHTGVKPYKCDICDRSFSQIQNMKTHKKVHIGKTDFICVTCGQNFTTKMSMMRHSERHEREDRMNPESENYDPEFTAIVRQKVVKKMADKTLGCSICKKSFTTKRGLVAHLRKRCSGLILQTQPVGPHIALIEDPNRNTVVHLTGTCSSAMPSLSMASQTVLSTSTVNPTVNLTPNFIPYQNSSFQHCPVSVVVGTLGTMDNMNSGNQTEGVQHNQSGPSTHMTLPVSPQVVEEPAVNSDNLQQDGLWQ